MHPKAEVGGEPVLNMKSLSHVVRMFALSSVKAMVEVYFRSGLISYQSVAEACVQWLVLSASWDPDSPGKQAGRR